MAIALLTRKQSHTYKLVDGPRLLVYQVREKSGKRALSLTGKQSHTYQLIDGTSRVVLCCEREKWQELCGLEGKVIVHCTYPLLVSGTNKVDSCCERTAKPFSFFEF